ncbi:hypothetical protein FIV39_19730 [Pseudomonas grimontii]|uniref:Uncharacterized protein n=1 Tax=Pseudomonas grimontii TaxID=129847 RepID=A0A5C5PGR9_9PSED|nr:hypothetical protein FIV39_19730 [Pseudomonas grimontii]
MKSGLNQTPKRKGWARVYSKIRRLGFSRFTALYRTVLYVVRGDTGTFSLKNRWDKFRFRR